MKATSLMPGTRVRVEQCIQGGEIVGLKQWHAAVEGTVVSCEAEMTSSWFAHSKSNRVWLLRLRLRKDDGEVSALNLDQSSRITVLALPAAEGAAK